MRVLDIVPKQISGQLAALMLFAVVMFHIMMASSFLIFPSLFQPPQRFEHDDWPGSPPTHGTWQFDPGPISGAAIPLFRPGEPGDHFHEPGDHFHDPGDRFHDPGDRFHHPPDFLGGVPVLPTLLFLTISVGVLGLWATRALIIPLKKFVRTAEQYRVGDGSMLLVEEGPTEVRALARALNEMQNRITELMADRTRMLAAISHDLRTPITRLRLRAEFMPELSEQRRMLSDLDHMEALVRGALMHLRDGKTGDGPVVADLSSLLQTISDQFGDLGYEVSYSGPEHVVARLRPHEFQRAVTNLVENAIRYGEAPAIGVTRRPTGELEITVEDSGPGIPEELRLKMLEPFARGDGARTMNEFEGFGLGLAIARSIAEAHHGRLELRDRVPHGLAAVIILPATIVVHYSA